MQKLAISVIEAGKALGLSRTTTYQLVNQGVIPSVRFGRRILVPISALQALLEVNSHNSSGTDVVSK